MKKKRKRKVGTALGSNLIVLAGLPPTTLNPIRSMLRRDTSLKPARYLGTPSTSDDWRNLYNKRNTAEMLRLIESECRSLSPNRLIVLYVPSSDAGELLSALGAVCFMAPLSPDEESPQSDVNAISWRHNNASVEKAVYQALGCALAITNTLKAEITDKRISPYTLPVHNFYYPDDSSTIASVYMELLQRHSNIHSLTDELLPSRFTREQLPIKAFKGKQHTSRFFQDSRGRVFPPDLYHAPNRDAYEGPQTDGISLTLRQRYRFGVTVRDGNLHYDVQYELPRKLTKEPMYCATMGDVWVTGSHANVGVNDVIWVPSGRKEAQNK